MSVRLRQGVRQSFTCQTTYKNDLYGNRWTDHQLDSRLSQRYNPDGLLQGASSNPCPVTSGVSQGSVIGPTLFLLYINDLLYQGTSKVHLFADDKIIYTTSDNSDKLMEDFRCLEQWEKDWSIDFHPAKCEYIRFSRKGVKSQLPSYMLHQKSRPSGIQDNRITWNDILTLTWTRQNHRPPSDL